MNLSPKRRLLLHIYYIGLLCALCGYRFGVNAFPLSRSSSPKWLRSTVGRRRTNQATYIQKREDGKLPLPVRATPCHLFPVALLDTASTSLPLNDFLSSTSALVSITTPTLFLSQFTTSLASMDQQTAEALAGPFFGFSLVPYLAFLWLLNVPENNTPKGVVVGFAALLVFVGLTIPAAICAKLWYGVSLADCDWLHASAESLLTATNLITIVAFRQALRFETVRQTGMIPVSNVMPETATSYSPMIRWMGGLTIAATATAVIPSLCGNAEVHTPYLGGFLDLSIDPTMTESLAAFGFRSQPENALSVGCWVIHVSSLLEFLAIMQYSWQWAGVTGNPKWKGLTWGLLPLHSSGLTACTYHFFYNQIPILVALQAMLTCLGNTTAAYAVWRIARSNGWTPHLGVLSQWMDLPPMETSNGRERAGPPPTVISLYGLPTLNDDLPLDGDFVYFAKLLGGSLLLSYAIKYGETSLSFPFDLDLAAALSVIGSLTALNAYNWYKRSQSLSI
jgi:hypothetical protein